MFATPDSPQEDEISRKVICRNSDRASFVVQVRCTDEILSFSAFDRCAVRVLQMKFGCGCLSFDQTISTYNLFSSPTWPTVWLQLDSGARPHASGRCLCGRGVC